jgi:fatty-acyl-CoA synthase
MEREGVTFTAAVPTVWLNLLQNLEATGRRSHAEARGDRRQRLPARDHRGVPEARRAGGACLGHDRDLAARHRLRREAGGRGRRRRAMLDLQESQGYPPFTVDMRIVGDDGAEKPWDGTTFGNLQVKGPTVTKSYFRAGSDVLTPDGWFETGDVATIDPNGYMHITDRTKDVIKSAASGSARSSWRTWPSATPTWRRPRWSRRAIRNGMSGRC